MVKKECSQSEEILFIGDSIVDVQMADKIGVKSVFIGNKDTGAWRTISEFKEFLPLLHETEGEQ